MADSEAKTTHPAFGWEPIAGADRPVNVSSYPPILWLRILTGVWYIGIAAIASWQAFRILRVRGLLHSAQPASNDVLSLVAEVGKQLGLQRIPCVRMLPVRVSPMVLSVGLRPQLLLPVVLFERLEPAAQRSLLAHELAHVRRNDHLVRLLELLVTTLFWWHPVLWWTRWELRQLEDLCCDAMVVGMMPGSKKVYATALLDTLDFLCDGSIATPLGVTATQSSVLLARRIAVMKNHSGVMRLTLGRLAVLVLLAVVPMSIAFATQAPKGDESNSANAGATVVIPSLDNTAESTATTPAPAPPQANDQSAKTSAAKPADEVSPATDQFAAKKGSKTESKPASVDGSTAKVNTDQARAIAEIEKLGGKVTIDEKSPGKPVITVDLRQTEVTDAGLEHLKRLPRLESLNLTRTKVTDAGMQHLEGLTTLRTLGLFGTHVTDAGLVYLDQSQQWVLHVARRGAVSPQRIA